MSLWGRWEEPRGFVFVFGWTICPIIHLISYTGRVEMTHYILYVFVNSRHIVRISSFDVCSFFPTRVSHVKNVCLMFDLYLHYLLTHLASAREICTHYALPSLHAVLILCLRTINKEPIR